MTIKNVKVFDLNSFEYKIKNTNEEIVSILEKAPIVYKAKKEVYTPSFDDEGVFLENTREICVGFVENAYFNDNGIFLGNVILNPKYSDLFNAKVTSQEILIDKIDYLKKEVSIKNILLYIEKL